MRDTSSRGLEAEVGPFALRTERLGPLPIVNFFLNRIGVPGLLERSVPSPKRGRGLRPSKALGVLLRSLLVEREPIYRQQETVSSYAPTAFDLTASEVARVGDDSVGRALDRLFDADRAAMVTELVVAACEVFAVSARELHNDSTSVRFAGQHAGSPGQSIRGRKVPWITYGHSKDHRPDLKQLLYILTTTEDGGIPVQFRCEAGNTSDSRTHIETWEALRAIAGRADFLYVADSKLCGDESMDHIDRAKGRFVTVLPRSRREDKWFREWIQTHEIEWAVVRNRPHPRRKKNGPRDIWRVFRAPVLSLESWPIYWVWSSLLTMKHGQSRRERIARATQELEALRQRLAGPRPRLRSRVQVQERADAILRRLKVGRYIKVRASDEADYRFRQEHRGRPGPDTRYHRLKRRRISLAWETDEAVVAYDRKSDGMYPLMTNDRTLTGQQVLEAHKRQPMIEKRFEQFKTVFEVAPMLLKNPGRIQALLFLYFVTLLVQALIEREVRKAMGEQGIDSIPLYPEERQCLHPTAEQIFRLFSLAERHTLLSGDRPLQIFQPKLTELQTEVLRLLKIPVAVYGPQTPSA